MDYDSKYLEDWQADHRVAGSETAKVLYDAKGWVAHHNTDIWRACGPVDAAYFGMWPNGGAWLAQHLWQHQSAIPAIGYVSQSALAATYSTLPAKNPHTVYLHPKYDWPEVCPSGICLFE